MRVYRLLTLGVLLAAGCSTASPFATSTQTPVPLAAQVDGGPPQVAGTAAGPLGGSQQQFVQQTPQTYVQSPPSTGNPLLAGLRSASHSIGQALTIEPQVVPAASPTALATTPTEIGADLHFQAAQVYEGQGNIAGAITHFQKALEKSPHDPRILAGFGRMYDRQGDLRQAQGLYQQALQADPQHSPAHNALGICYAKQGNLDAALHHLALAGQIQPQNVRYKNNLANVLADAGRIDEAYAQLVAAHGEAGAHYNLGYLLHKQGKQEAARQHLRLALQANPYLDQARNLLATLEPATALPPTGGPATTTAPGHPSQHRFSVSQPIDTRAVLTAGTVSGNEPPSRRQMPLAGPGPYPQP